ncbi:MAG: REP-associated tyrosine transposase [Bacteroidia bacterium]
MSEFRITTPNELFFVTLTTVGWVDVFTRNDYKNILVENLQYCQKNENLDIYSYVIMSNHIHMICRRQDKDLKELLGRFKSYSAKQIITAIENNPQESRKEWLLYLFNYFAKTNNQYSKNHFWQYTTHPVLLYSNDVIKQKMDYIHLNPVRAGLVNEPENYIYSSANVNSPLKVLQF